MRPFTKLAARLALGAWAAFSGLNAQAAPASVEGAFGNTIVSTYPDGRSQSIWLHDGGTWDGLSRRGHPLAGKWSLKGEKVCLKQTRPALPFSFCQALPTDTHVGVAMASKDFSGTPITLKIVQGIVRGASAAGN
jgi:hypothetical protein